MTDSDQHDDDVADDRDDLTPRQWVFAVILGILLLGLLSVVRGVFLEDLSLDDAIVVAILVMLVVLVAGAVYRIRR